MLLSVGTPPRQWGMRQVLNHPLRLPPFHRVHRRRRHHHHDPRAQLHALLNPEYVFPTIPPSLSYIVPVSPVLLPETFQSHPAEILSTFWIAILIFPHYSILDYFWKLLVFVHC